MSRQQPRDHRNGNGARGPVPRIAAVLAIACVGTVGGLVLASYATGGTRSFAEAVTYDDSAWSDPAAAGDEAVVEGGLSHDAPKDYRCRGCGPGLAAQTAARYGTGSYDSAAYDYGAGDADDDVYRVEEGGDAAPPLPPYRPMPFDGPATAPLPVPAAATRRPPAPTVRPVLPPLPADRLPAAGDTSLAPATSQDHPAGGKAQQQKS